MAASLSAADVLAMTVAQLRTKLSQRGLDSTGKKATLQARLAAAVNSGIVADPGLANSAVVADPALADAAAAPAPVVIPPALVDGHVGGQSGSEPVLVRDRDDRGPTPSRAAEENLRSTIVSVLAETLPTLLRAAQIPSAATSLPALPSPSPPGAALLPPSGLPTSTVPRRIADRILTGEFVSFDDLLPDVSGGIRSAPATFHLELVEGGPMRMRDDQSVRLTLLLFFSSSLTGNGSDSGKRKKDKRRSSRKKKGHLRQRSEDLNNNDPTAHSAGFPEASASSTAPTHRRRRSTGVPAASLSSSAAAAIFSNRDPYDLSSSSDEALNVLASAGGEQDYDVSCLRDEFSQEVKLNQFPTPEPSSPATPTLRLRPSGDHPHPRPYSSDVDTGEVSYDVLADSASVASEPIGAVARGRSNSQRSDDEWLGGFDQANVDNVIDRFSELSEDIEKEYSVAIARIVQKLTKGYSFHSYEEYKRLALELLGQIVLLVMTSHLLSAPPDNVRHLEIERHSSRLLKEYFFEYFHAGATHALSWFRRSFRRGEDGIAEVRRQSARAGGGAEATGGASAIGGGAAVSGGIRRTRTSPLVVADQSAAAAPTLRLRGAPAGSSARETGLRQLQQRGSSTPVLRLRPASSAPGHGSHLSEGDQLEGDEEDVMHE